MRGLTGKIRQSLHRLDVLGAHAERRYARRVSTQLLALYHQQRRERPDLAGRALYESIVARRLGSEAARAPALIRSAEESFTDWPVERQLRFRHVVHYLVFYEYMHTGKHHEGTKTNMGGVVARIIPEEI